MITSRSASRPLVTLALLVAAVGSAAAQTTHTVSTSGFTFSPANVVIAQGDSVNWTGLQPSFHNVAETNNPPNAGSTHNGGFYSGPPNAVPSFLHTFDTPGTFAYICETHVGFGMFGTVTVMPGGVGTPACVGTGTCPCGNDDPGAGCANSTGIGGRLAGSRGASVSADDLLLLAWQLPPMNNGLVYMGDTLVDNPFFDGRQCALGTTFRFLSSIQNTGTAGTMTFTGVVAASGGLITPGSTWFFHAWHRDSPGSPCGTGANLTHTLGVTFGP